MRFNGTFLAAMPRFLASRLKKKDWRPMLAAAAASILMRTAAINVKR
jgi:hypothetical protein